MGAEVNESVNVLMCPVSSAGEPLLELSLFEDACPVLYNPKMHRGLKTQGGGLAAHVEEDSSLRECA